MPSVGQDRWLQGYGSGLFMVAKGEEGRVFSVKSSYKLLQDLLFLDGHLSHSKEVMFGAKIRRCLR